MRFEGKNFRCKTVDAFRQFSPKRKSNTTQQKNIEHMDDIGTVHCVFDNGRTLGVIPGVDDFHIVSEDSEQTEDEGMNISM